MSTLEQNVVAAAYFGKVNRNVQAGYRRALRDAGIALPPWAKDRRNVSQSIPPISDIGTAELSIATQAKVATQPRDDPANAVALPDGFILPVLSDDDAALNSLFG